MHLLYIPTYLSARILPQADKQELERQFADFKQWLWENYTQEDNFWHVNPYGWKRWEAILKFVEAEDHTHLLPDFKDYIQSLDSVRGTQFTAEFPELAHLVA
jgi:hypothetical protein